MRARIAFRLQSSRICAHVWLYLFLPLSAIILSMPLLPDTPTPRADTLKLYLLGSFQLDMNARHVQLATHKIESLLAYLVLHPQSHLREKLAALLWADFSDAQARASLRNALTVLRRAIGVEALVTDRETVQLNPALAVWVDALEFQAHATAFLATTTPVQNAVALDLYRGELLADFYDEWIFPLREKWQQHYFDMLARTAEMHRAEGEHAKAIGAAERLLAHDSVNEAAHRLVMLSYFALGDTAAAMRQFERCKQVLRAELNIEPSAETMALAERIQQTTARAPFRATVLTNLPTPLTSFIGRERLVQQITELVTSAENGAVTRLLTLTGAGGSGKTRLAIHAAKAIAQRGAFEDGVWWVELAAVNDAVFLPQAVAKVVGVREAPERSLTELLVTELTAARVLLVLDNCEHLLIGCAQLVEQLLYRCPQLRVMTTSREPLGVLGESVLPVPPLELADSNDGVNVFGAVQLFVERAAAVQSGFSINAANANAIAQLCQRLDGIPLAIELAAARIKVLSPEQIVARLDDRFNLLTSGNRAALPRHQTLRATFDWSYDLLDADEQRLFWQLSVFVGGFALDAAEALGGSNALALLARLVDKSLVVVENQFNAPRYRMLETIRAYARDKLWLTGAEADARQLHLRWFAQYAERAENELMSAQQSVWLNRLEADYANLIAAMQFATESGARDDVDAGLRLGAALFLFWGYRGYVTEARGRLMQLLNLSHAEDVSRARALGLNTLGALATRQADYRNAIESLTQSIALWENLRDAHRMGFALHWMAWAHTALGEFSQAHRLHEQAIVLRRELGELGKRDLAESLTYLGLLAYYEGDYATARVVQEEALALKQAIGETWTMGFSRWNLGIVAYAEGDYAAARQIYRNVLSILRDLKDRWGMPHVLEFIGYLLQAEGETQRAVVLFGVTEALRAATGTPTPDIMRRDLHRAMANARAALGDADFDAAFAEGKGMALSRAIELALAW